MKISDEELAAVLKELQDKGLTHKYAMVYQELQTLRELAIEAKRANNERPAYADEVLAEKIKKWEQL